MLEHHWWFVEQYLKDFLFVCSIPSPGRLVILMLF